MEQDSFNDIQREPCKGLFVTDFDGTLLGSNGSLARRDLEALDYLSRHGVKTAIATGRSLYSFNNSPGSELPIDYLIFSSGAGVVARSESRLLYQVNISAEMVVQSLDFLNDSRFDFMLHYPVPGNHEFLYRRSSRNNTDFETRIKKYGKYSKPLNSVPPNGFGEAAQFLAVVPRNETHDALRLARNGLPGLNVIRTTSPLDHQSTWIEFFHQDVSKGRTAAWLASKLNVDPVNTVAIGNDYNDEDLLQWAARSFVVENAPDELKSNFQQVASNNNGGVAEAVDRWLGTHP